MSRHPISRNWKGPIAFLAATIAAFVALVWAESYLLAAAVLIAATVWALVYATGESSDLPGTAGDDDKDVPT